MPFISIAILDKRLKKKGNITIAKMLVQWLQLSTKEATQEEFDKLCANFLNFLSQLEDKDELKKYSKNTGFYFIHFH